MDAPIESSWIHDSEHISSPEEMPLMVVEIWRCMCKMGVENLTFNRYRMHD